MTRWDRTETKMGLTRAASYKGQRLRAKSVANVPFNWLYKFLSFLHNQLVHVGWGGRDENEERGDNARGGWGGGGRATVRRKCCTRTERCDSDSVAPSGGGLVAPPMPHRLRPLWAPKIGQILWRFTIFRVLPTVNLQKAIGTITKRGEGREVWVIWWAADILQPPNNVKL